MNYAVSFGDLIRRKINLVVTGVPVIVVNGIKFVSNKSNESGYFYFHCNGSTHKNYPLLLELKRKRIDPYVT